MPIIKVSLSSQSLEIEGNEQFIEKHYEKLLEEIRSFRPLQLPPTEQNTLSNHQIASRCLPQNDNSLSKYIEHGIFYMDEETGLPVLQASVPGDNKREQMRNVAAILLYAADKPIPSAYIKTQCERQSCLDAANFSKTYEKDKKNFIKKGKTGSRDWHLELTIPGKKAACELLDSMIEM